MNLLYLAKKKEVAVALNVCRKYFPDARLHELHFRDGGQAIVSDDSKDTSKKSLIMKEVHKKIYGSEQKKRPKYRNHKRLLSQEEVIAIRARLDNGESEASLSRAFRVSIPVIVNIKRGKTYKWV